MTNPIKPPNIAATGGATERSSRKRAASPRLDQPRKSQADPAEPSAQKGLPSAAEEELLRRYNCGPVKLSGSENALYERHLTFDQVIPVSSATPRDKFEAIAHSIRDVLSQRWLRTEQTYQSRNVKRVYYLSLEFLMGRALANNITNLMLDSLTSQFCEDKRIDPLEIIGAPDAAAPQVLAFSIRWPRWPFPAWAAVCATNTASSNNPSAMAGSSSNQTIGSPAPIPGK